MYHIREKYTKLCTIPTRIKRIYTETVLFVLSYTVHVRPHVTAPLRVHMCVPIFIMYYNVRTYVYDIMFTLFSVSININNIIINSVIIIINIFSSGGEGKMKYVYNIKITSLKYLFLHRCWRPIKRNRFRSIWKASLARARGPIDYIFHFFRHSCGHEDGH